MRRAIIVLGMHRSGTSALAGTLVHLGATAPRTVMPATPENERGYFESLLLYRFNEDLLASAGSNWFDWRRIDPEWRASTAATIYRSRGVALLRDEFGESPLLVLKDPRVCRLVPFWLDVLFDLGISPLILIPFRPPLEVALSLLARDRIVIADGLLIWLRHIIDAERYTRDLPRSFIEMDDLISDWRSSCARISQELGIEWPNLDAAAAEAIDGFLSPNLKHHSKRAEARNDTWVTRAYEGLRTLAADPTSRLARAAFDDLATQFEQACSMFAPIIHKCEDAINSDTMSIGVTASSVDEASLIPSLDTTEIAASLRALRRQLEHLRTQVNTGQNPEVRSARTRRKTMSR